MPLTNFGAILNFAEKVEQEDMEFYRVASSTDAGAPYRLLLDMFARDGKKLISLIKRTRRENVTEMILEPIKDFTRQAFMIAPDELPVADPQEVVKAAVKIEDRNLRYYTEAARKIKALPEVATALKQLSKKQKSLLGKLEELL